MHEVEKELIKATGYKPLRKFSDRQDYLKSILNAVSKLEDADFEHLSDEAATWANAAVEAHNAKDVDLPDFDEVGDPEEEIEEVEVEAGAVIEHDPGPDDEAEGQPEDELPHDDELHEDDDEDEPEVKPTKAKKAAPKKPEQKEPTLRKVAPVTKTHKDDPEVELDKWGAMAGSKNSRALAMFEKGATTKEVKDTIGGTYYNVLKKMAQNGHKVEKEGSLIKLTHTDDMKSGKAAVKKKK